MSDKPPTYTEATGFANESFVKEPSSGFTAEGPTQQVREDIRRESSIRQQVSTYQPPTTVGSDFTQQPTIQGSNRLSHLPNYHPPATPQQSENSYGFPYSAYPLPYPDDEQRRLSMAIQPVSRAPSMIRYSIHQQITVNQAPLSEYSVQTTCFSCRNEVFTQTKKEAKDEAWTICTILFCFGGLLCAWIPFAMESMYRTKHRCPICHARLGVYNA